MSNNSATCIFHDSEGYIWIGTEDGLNRFDGYSFTVFRSRLNDTTSLTENIIKTIFEDHKKNLWVITFIGSINRFDRQTATFKQYHIGDQLNLMDVPFDPAARMYEDRQQNLWAYNRTVYKYLPGKDKFMEVDLNLAIPEMVVYFFYEDSDNDFWIGTNEGLLKYNWNDSTYISFKAQNEAADPAGNIFYSITEDAGGVFWLGSSRGLCRFDKNAGKFTGRWKVSSSPGKGIAFIDIPSLLNSHSYIWMTWQCWNDNKVGISRFNKNTSELTIYPFDSSLPVGPSVNVPVNMIEDRSGLVWVGTFMGGVFMFEKERRFETLMTGHTICAFTEDKKGNLWLAASKDGIYRYNFTKGELKHIKSTNKFGQVNTMIVDPAGTLWFGTYSGLYRIKGLLQSPGEIKVETMLEGKVKVIALDWLNRLWIGMEGSLCFFDPASGEKIFFRSEANNPNSLSNNSVESIVADKQAGALWVGTWDGLNMLNLSDNDKPLPGKTKILQFRHSSSDLNSLSENKVISLCLDGSGVLWAGTYGGGLNRIERFKTNNSQEFYKIHSISTNEGLPNNVVYGVLADKNNNLWVSTNDGLASLDASNGTIKIYGANDGLQGNQFFWRSYHLGASGRMYFGGGNGFNAFHPESLKNNTYLPPVKIIGFSVFNKPVVPGDANSPLNVQIDQAKEIVIKHSQSVISFDYAALNFNQPEKNNYAYKMEGFDKDWQYVGTQRKATYTNLNPGKYIFRVKASNNDGIWNEQGTSIRLVIVPPFWLTWWFRVLLVLVVVFSAIAIFRIRIKSIRDQKEHLEKVVKERTHELLMSNNLLKKQSEELNETNTLLEERQQLIEEQSEELMAQKDELVNINQELQNLNATKDKFFSIIAHDIKNPFNTILGFSELFLYNIDKWNDEKKRQIAEIIYKSSQSLYQLLENLLQWSRSQRGLIAFKPELCDLNQQVNNAVKLLNESASSKNISISTRFVTEQISINADLHMLDTILRNLISNAIKFSYSGGTVWVETIVEGNTHAVVSVIDNGTGMQEEVRSNLFSIGSHHSSTGTNDEKGSGLGLILVKEFVLRHGGGIWVESEPGKGSTFCFRLPLSN
ncbi:MAG: hypothetical protein JXB34_11305 [Bacteroidales bacterium]|nr:hypothetical protein [Bacteroidales bacterium]